MATPTAKPEKEKALNLLARWNAMPLYYRIVLAMLAGLVTGLLLGKHALPAELVCRQDEHDPSSAELVNGAPISLANRGRATHCFT